MKTKILHNPTDKDIIDYRIEEAEEDRDGNPIIDEELHKPKWTGKTWEWSIKANETVEFPCYVADYLKSIFDFLEFVDPITIEEKKETVVDPELKAGGDYVCEYCGKTFTAPRNLALHLGSTHYDKLVKSKT